MKLLLIHPADLCFKKSFRPDTRPVGTWNVFPFLVCRFLLLFKAWGMGQKIIYDQFLFGTYSAEAQPIQLVMMARQTP